MGKFAVCDCGIYRSYSLKIFNGTLYLDFLLIQLHQSDYFRPFQQLNYQTTNTMAFHATRKSIVIIFVNCYQVHHLIFWVLMYLTVVVVVL